jgi:hypothetical protein
MVHFAKVDRWVGSIFGGATTLVFVLAATFLVLGITAGEPPLSTAIGIAVIDGAIGALLLVLWRGCYRIRYEIDSTELLIRFGLFSTKVPLDSIEEVFPTRNPTSAPAPSLDRVQIEYRTDAHTRRTALVSPQDRSAFIRDLAAAAPRLQDVGDGRLRNVG